VRNGYQASDDICFVSLFKVCLHQPNHRSAQARQIYHPIQNIGLIWNCVFAMKSFRQSLDGQTWTSTQGGGLAKRGREKLSLSSEILWTHVGARQLM
jgi:hypothetical protein